MELGRRVGVGKGKRAKVEEAKGTKGFPDSGIIGDSYFPNDHSFDYQIVEIIRSCVLTTYSLHFVHAKP